MDKISWQFEQQIQFNQLSCWLLEVNGKPREALKQNTLCNQQRGMLYRLGPEGWEDIKDLTSSQEEADTCILLHASRASKQGHKSVIIVFEDTYVLILCLAFNKEMASPLYVKYTVLNWTRYLDITKLVSYWRWCLSCTCWLHAFTECDSVSAFSGRWKARAAL